MIILKRIQLALFGVSLMLLLTPHIGFASDDLSMNTLPNVSVTPNSTATSSGNQTSPCQQLCYEQYKAGTDICYSTSIASEDLNSCIMNQREVFKMCSKSC